MSVSEYPVVRYPAPVLFSHFFLDAIIDGTFQFTVVLIYRCESKCLEFAEAIESGVTTVLNGQVKVRSLVVSRLYMEKAESQLVFSDRVDLLAILLNHYLFGRDGKIGDG